VATGVVLHAIPPVMQRDVSTTLSLLNCSGLQPHQTTKKPSNTLPFIFSAVSVSRDVIIGIAVGGLVILLLILAAACWPRSPAVSRELSVSKQGDCSNRYILL
jgi:hypothetical protein